MKPSADSQAAASEPAPNSGRQRLPTRLVAWLNSNESRHQKEQLAIAFVVYGCVALAAYWPVYPGDSARAPIRNSDATQDIWFLEWTSYALSHGQNLFFTKLIDLPLGVNTAQNTQMPLLGLITSPLTHAAGPLASFTLLAWLAFPISALAAAVVMLRWCGWFPAAAFGGALYGFGPYLVNQGVGHLNLTFVPLPPLILLATYELFVSRRRPLTWGCWLGLFVILQYYISPEIAASTVLVVAVGLAILGVLHRRDARRVLRRAVPGLAAGFFLVLFGTVVPVWWMLAGAGHFSGPIQPPGNPFHADLLGALIPTSRLRFYPASWKTAGDTLLADNFDENGSFLGIPLLATLAILAWQTRKNRWVVFVSVMVALSFLASLGPRLTIDGHEIPIYLALETIAKVPLLDDLLPSRWSNYVMLFVAVAVSLGLTEWHRRSRTSSTAARRAPRSLVACAVVATLLSLIPAWPYPFWSEPVPNALLAAVRTHVPIGSTVLAYPFPASVDDQAMLWQALSGMRFRLVGGYALHRSSSGSVKEDPPMLTPNYVQIAFTYYPTLGILHGSAAPLLAFLRPAGIDRFLAANGIGAIVLDRQVTYAAQIASLVSAAVGPPRFENRDVEIWLEPAHQGGPQSINR